MIVVQSYPDGTPREVELTPEEAAANARWDELLDAGSGIAAAADLVEQTFPGLDPAFYDYLRR